MKEKRHKANEKKRQNWDDKNYIEMNEGKKTESKWRKRQNWDDKNYIEMNGGKKRKANEAKDKTETIRII